MNDILGKLSGGINKEQVIFSRLKEILKDSKSCPESSSPPPPLIPKEDAKFIQLHLNNKWPKYHMYFGDYSLEMIQKLSSFIEFGLFHPEQDIYVAGEESKWFYYLLSGAVHLIEVDKEGEQRQIASLLHENQVFGFDKASSQGEISTRARTAKAEKETLLLKINILKYENIRKERVLSKAEAKIEYLTRFIPGFRSVQSKIIDEWETLFKKEKVTKGFRIIEQGKINDFLYFIVSGSWRLLYNYAGNKRIASKFEMIDATVSKFIHIGKLGVGDWIGQTSALAKTPSKYSAQVETEEAVLYKISWNTFYDSFGKDQGKPVRSLRGKAVMDTNWINTVLKTITSKSSETLLQEWTFVEKAHEKTSERVMIEESPFLTKSKITSIFQFLD